mmetsp:Transcript_8685/g.32497  ORF Transcript_8685/g.32497 Transcript_8685/m.32497 type:complete len:235 (+) Transcript_8685:939-1643(+)
MPPPSCTQSSFPRFTLPGILVPESSLSSVSSLESTNRSSSLSCTDAASSIDPRPVNRSSPSASLCELVSNSDCETHVGSWRGFTRPPWFDSGGGGFFFCFFPSSTSSSASPEKVCVLVSFFFVEKRLGAFFAFRLIAHTRVASTRAHALPGLPSLPRLPVSLPLSPKSPNVSVTNLAADGEKFAGSVPTSANSIRFAKIFCKKSQLRELISQRRSQRLIPHRLRGPHVQFCELV